MIDKFHFILAVISAFGLWMFWLDTPSAISWSIALVVNIIAMFYWKWRNPCH
jgi:hypothetical protein